MATLLLLSLATVAARPECPFGASLADRNDVYLGSAQYQHQTAAEKLAHITNRLNATRGSSGVDPGVVPRALDFLFASRARLTEVFDFKSDELAAGSSKHAHPVGTHARVRWSPGAHNYSGLWAVENATGIMRLSHTGIPTTNLFGVALKFLRGKRSSANLLFLCTNCTEMPMSSNFSNLMGGKKDTTQKRIISDGSFAATLLNNKYMDAFTGPAWPNKIGISDMALYTEAGEKVVHPSTPFALLLDPYPEIRALDSKPEGAGWDDVLLTNLKAGNRLFRVLAIARPGADPHPIGSLSLVDDLFRSSWGDQHLKFNHQDFRDDLNLNMKWMSMTDQWADHLGGETRTQPLHQWPVMRLFQPCAALATAGLMVSLAISVTFAAGQPANQTRRSEAPSGALWQAIQGVLTELTDSNKCKIVSSSQRDRDKIVEVSCDTAMDAGRSVITLEQAGGALTAMTVSRLHAESYVGAIPSRVSVVTEAIYESTDSSSGSDDGLLVVLVGVALGLVLLVGLLVAAGLVYISRDGGVARPCVGPSTLEPVSGRPDIKIETNPVQLHAGLPASRP